MKRAVNHLLLGRVKQDSRAILESCTTFHCRENTGHPFRKPHRGKAHCVASLLNIQLPSWLRYYMSHPMKLSKFPSETSAEHYEDHYLLSFNKYSVIQSQHRMVPSLAPRIIFPLPRFGLNCVEQLNLVGGR